MSISESALLVKLSIGTWTANKLDKDRTEQLLSSSGASGDAAQVRKNLMAGTRAAKDITDFAANCRLMHTVRTLPWEDRGFRVIPTSIVLDYKQEMTFMKSRFLLMVGEFCSNYDRHIHVARQSLGSMFNQSDYPDVHQVREKYHFDLTFSPIPDEGHFFLDIPQQDLKEMRDSVTKLNQERLEHAMSTAWERLHKILVGMSTKLSECDEKTRFHDSFITNASELCELLTHLNITNDPDLERARVQLQQAVQGTNIDSIKESPLARDNLRAQVDSILDKFNW